MNLRDLDLFNKLREERIKLAESLENPALRKVKNLVVDQYPESAHFIYELSQNADDACATKVVIKLDDKGLIFKHNGTIRFTITEETYENYETGNIGHINSITAIGASSKSDTNDDNKIGKFGIGFKAVFQYTNAPEIYDEGFRFRIDRLIVPTLIEKDHYERNEDETLFYFPFNNDDAYYEISEKLSNLENPLLFLNNLQEITWEDTQDGTKHCYKKELLSTHIKNNVVANHLCIDNCGVHETIWLFTKSIKVEGKEHNICVGYYLNEDGTIKTDIRPKVHCFFPTMESLELCMIIHAPFMLTSTRQQLKSCTTNEDLLSELRKLILESLLHIRDIGIKDGSFLLSNTSLLKIIPIEKPKWTYSLMYKQRNNLYDDCKILLINDKIFLCEDRKYRVIQNMSLPRSKDLMNLLNHKKISTLAGRDVFYIHKELMENFSDIEIFSYNSPEWKYLKEIGAYDLYDNELSDLLKKNIDFLKGQSDNWIRSFYDYLLEHPNIINQGIFKYAPIIKISNGDFVAPYKDKSINDFYEVSNSIIEGLNIVDNTIISHPKVKELYDKLGIKDVERKNYIDSLFEKYREVDKLDDAVILSDFTFALEHYKSLDDSQRKEFVDEYSSKIKLVGKLGTEQNLYHPNDLYNKDFLSRFAVTENYVVFDSIFYRSIINNNEKLFWEFVYRLGVVKTFRIKNIKIEPFNYQNFSPKQYEQLREEWNRITSYGSPTYCNEGYDWVIETFNDLIENKFNIELSKELWNYLISVIQKEGDLDSYNYFRQKYFYRTDKCAYLISTFKESLLAKDWLFNGEDKPKKPSEVNWSTLSQLGYQYNNVLLSYLNISQGGIFGRDGISEEEAKIYERGSHFESDEDAMLAAELLRREKERRVAKLRIQENNEFLQRDRLRETSIEQTFVHTNQDAVCTLQCSEVDNENNDDKRNEIEEQIEKERDQKLERERLRELAVNSEPYTSIWFKSLLQLEYNTKVEDNELAISSKAISISFQKVERESERIYVLRNPSRIIPQQLEEIGGITVEFEFRNKEESSFSFEVANVRNFTLRLKAKATDMLKLSEINWSECTKAVINANNPIDLISKLTAAFDSLGLPDDFNLKTNLRSDLKFIFGPPGTGKTTYLANKILDIQADGDCKILVLAPTNKACDVLTSRIIDTATEKELDYSWLKRFVATADKNIDRLGALCDRDSGIYEGKCCIVSTIARLPYDGFKYDKLFEIQWDYIIIDEASMIPLAQIIFPIYNFKDSVIIIAGDPFQIDPIVREKLWENENIYRMINLNNFESLTTEPKQFEIIPLLTQYRSIPSIGKLFSEYTYGGMLKHNRTEEEQNTIEVKGLSLKSLNFLQFRYDKYDSVFGAKKLNGSNIHIYSALLTYEFAIYIANNIDSNRIFSIGIICPYVAQAHMINALLEQRSDIPTNVKIITGTIHGFQGDQCNMIISVFNPPKGLERSVDKVFLNKTNIINVAISRAQDYLVILMPHRDSSGYEKLYELNKLGRIASNYTDYVNVMTSDFVEEIIWNDRSYIERNTFVTTHQMTNVYSGATSIYEVRVDETAADVQINEDAMA